MQYHPPFIGAIDQGTSSTRFIIFDYHGNLVTNNGQQFDSLTPHAGWIEQDLNVIWDTVCNCLTKGLEQFVSKGYSPNELKAIGITNQRESIGCWDSTTGEPLCNLIVWSDLRTQALNEYYKDRYEQMKLQEITGLRLSTYFSALKIKYLIDNNDNVKHALEENRLMVGTVDTWLMYKLAKQSKLKKDIYITDVTNASRTMLMDIRKLEWSNKMLGFFDIPKDILPQIVSSSKIYFNLNCFGLNNVPVSGCLGDQQAAMIRYGTGCFLLFNIGNEFKLSKNQLLTTIAYQFGDSKPVYAFEGSVAVAGSAMKWLKQVGIINNFDEIDQVASKVSDTGDVYFVTAFSGLFAPYWQPNARGHITRAALEATCFQIKAIADAMDTDSDLPLKVLKVGGGLSKSEVCMQLQADILGIKVERPQLAEMTALGVAMAAGLAVKVWNDEDELCKLNEDNITGFEPKINKQERNKKYARWNQAVKKSFGWVKM